MTVSLSLYVRMIPTFEEQGRHCIWRSDRSEGAGTKEPETELAQVWQRVDLCPLVAAVDLDVLWQRRKLVSSLAVDIQQAWKPVRESLHGRYERSSGARIPRSAFTREGFAAWCASLAPTAPREDWTADLDVRLTAMPTVAGHSRVSLRIINRTGAPDGRGSAFFDPNLYAARIAVEVPNCARERVVSRARAELQVRPQLARYRDKRTSGRRGQGKRGSPDRRSSAAGSGPARAKNHFRSGADV